MGWRVQPLTVYRPSVVYSLAGTHSWNWAPYKSSEDVPGLATSLHWSGMMTPLYYAAVISIGRIMRLAHPSVRPSICRMRAPGSKIRGRRTM